MSNAFRPQLRHLPVSGRKGALINPGKRRGLQRLAATAAAGVTFTEEPGHSPLRAASASRGGGNERQTPSASQSILPSCISPSSTARPHGRGGNSQLLPSPSQSRPTAGPPPQSERSPGTAATEPPTALPAFSGHFRSSFDPEWAVREGGGAYPRPADRKGTRLLCCVNKPRLGRGEGGLIQPSRLARCGVPAAVAVTPLKQAQGLVLRCRQAGSGKCSHLPMPPPLLLLP